MLDEKYRVKFVIPNERVNELERDCRNKKKHPVLIAPITDCYQPIEGEKRITRKCIEILSAHHFPIMIQTKGRVVKDDVHMLSNADSVVSISLSSLDTDLLKRLEPKAPSPSERLDVLQYLSENGVRTTVFVDPLIPRINDEERGLEDTIKGAKNAGALQVTTGILRLDSFILKLLKGSLEEREVRFLEILYLKRGVKRGGYWFPPQAYTLKIVKLVSEICKKYELSFGSCRTGFSEFNTSACDGQNYLNFRVNKTMIDYF